MHHLAFACTSLNKPCQPGLASALPASAPSAGPPGPNEGLATAAVLEVQPAAASVTLAKVLAGSGLAVLSRRRCRGRQAGRQAAGAKVEAHSTLIEPDECRELIGRSRPAHWVIRTSDLRASLRFLSEVFGMETIRHEEYSKPCAITCNGPYRTPWSKTMVGFGPEDEGYCLELTYNYTVPGYAAGEGLAHIAVGADSPAAALATAAGMGYAVAGDTITGPDGYRYRVVPQQPERRERFQYIALRVANLPKAAAFYEQTLGMNELPACSEVVASAGSAAGPARVLGYSPAQVPLLLLEGGAAWSAGDRSWEGRNAIAIPGRALRAAYQRIADGSHGGGVLHRIREFNEMPALRRQRGLPPMSCQPSPEDALRALREDPSSAPSTGTLTVAIVKDADGYEICLVSSEAFNEAVRQAYDPGVEIDWAWREEAQAGRRSPNPKHMLVCV